MVWLLPLPTSLILFNSLNALLWHGNHCNILPWDYGLLCKWIPTFYFYSSQLKMGRQLIEKMKQLLIVDSHKFVLDPLNHVKPWNSLWLFLKLTLSNHLRNCIKNIVNKNNSTWEVECKIGKVSLQDGQNLKETGIISGFIKGKMWVIFLKFSWQTWREMTSLSMILYSTRRTYYFKQYRKKKKKSTWKRNVILFTP